MASPRRSDITGLVLAGGRGTRMGGIDKGWVAYRGSPMIRTVFERLAPQVDSVLISANRNLADYRTIAPTFTDEDCGLALEEYPGPLAALMAAWRFARTDWIATTPCDAPELALDLVERLAKALDDESPLAAVARAGGRLQPTFALVHRTTASSLQSYLQGRGRAVHGWLRSIDARIVDFEDAAAFANVNERAPLSAPGAA